MNEADIPIDIHTQKLQDWLVSRRIVSKNYQPYIKDIRSKISNALEDMPPNEQLIQLLSGTQINYFHCKEIVEILKLTEKDTKSLFGTYGSQRMKDWQEILRLYERDNVYLAEAAQIYARNINYEIPSIKKQIARFQHQAEDTLKKVKELNRSEQNVLNDYRAQLKKLGIKGDNLREEFTEALKKLPEMYNKSIENIADLNDGIQYYLAFAKDATRLPITRHIIEFGNTTVYQYIRKEAPLSVVENPITLLLTEETVPSTDNKNIDSAGGIDFGDSGDDIDWGIESAPAENQDIAPNANSKEEHGIAIEEESGGEIDWGIESEPTESQETDVNVDSNESHGITVESSGMEGGVAKGKQAYTILDSPKYREHFINELWELHSFLHVRIMELKVEDIASSILYAQNDLITMYDVGVVTKMLTHVKSLLAKLKDEDTIHHFQLKHYPEYAEMLATKLRQSLKKVDRIRATKEQLTAKSAQLKEDSVKLNPILESYIRQTKALQTQIEKDISKRYKNRVVNLMGGLNTI